ncbi:MAG: InlB B-repeat-containing protein [Bacteroidales bacterium]|nr:InlB B-repeat-containing protein [Bacteroidales bacterium]
MQNIVLMPESGGDNIEKVTITYNINGGTGITPAPQTVNVGDRVLIASGSGFSRSGFNFNGWNTNSSGTGDSYSPPGSITPTRNITLFAYWSIIVTYNINGGSGTTPSSSTIREGGSTTLANRDYISRSGFSFGGWNTNSSGTGTNYHSKATFTPTNNVTLFAKWVAKVGREGSFTDERDGQIYRTVTIGNQTWMAENLNWAGYRGDLGVCYANNPNNCDVYGRLYNWSGATGKVSSCYSGNVTNCLNSPIVSGNCPDGWYVPRGTEWLILGEFVGSPSRPKLSSTTGWGASVCNGLCLDSPSTDDFGFSALPGGVGDSDGFSAVGVVGRWWNANSNMESHASSAVITPNAVNVTTDSQRKTTLFSLRCIAD